MVQVRTVLVCCLGLLALTNASIERFLYKNTSPKCCKPNEILSLTEEASEYRCTFATNASLFAETATHLLEFPKNIQTCIDVMVTVELKQGQLIQIEAKGLSRSNLSATHLPKCCPINSAYDLSEHKCIKNGKFADEFIRQSSVNGSFIVKLGLVDCNTVIADYVTETLDSSIFRDDNAIFVEKLNETVAYGKYCLDKVYNSEDYVVRVCHENFDVCKKRKTDVGKIKCITKCCADGHILRKNSKDCTVDFSRGLGLINDSHVRNSEEPFAILLYESVFESFFMLYDYDDYYVNERGYVVEMPEENFPMYRSPFRDDYCIDYMEDFDTYKILITLKNTDY